MSDEIEKLREELAEANARRADLRTALEWACEERDRLREQLAAKHSACPDCADYAARSGRFAEQADRLQRERDEARAEVEHAYREGGALYEAKIAQREAETERDEARAEVATAAKYCDELAETIRMHIAREIELEAEVERLQEMAHDFNAMRKDRDMFYRAGQNAEREAEQLRTALDQASVAMSKRSHWLETARAEVKRLHEELNKSEDRVQYAVDGHLTRERCKDAYRRGAEAMRAQVMDWLARAQAEATVIVVDTAIRGVHKLPIPEDK